MSEGWDLRGKSLMQGARSQEGLQGQRLAERSLMENYVSKQFLLVSGLGSSEGRYWGSGVSDGRDVEACKG